MHASTVTLDIDSPVGKVFLERDGLKLLLILLEEKLQDDKINWKIMHRLVQTLFVLCFRERSLKALKQENILKKLVDVLVKAIENRQMDVVIQIIKLFTFFSDD